MTQYASGYKLNNVPPPKGKTVEIVRLEVCVELGFR